MGVIPAAAPHSRAGRTRGFVQILRSLTLAHLCSSQALVQQKDIHVQSRVCRWLRYARAATRRFNNFYGAGRTSFNKGMSRLSQPRWLTQSSRIGIEDESASMADTLILSLSGLQPKNAAYVLQRSSVPASRSKKKSF